MLDAIQWATSAGLLHGAAQGLLFSIFAVAAIGKLVGCQAGSPVMCRKAALDAAMALGVCAMGWTPALWIVAVLAIAIGAGGWMSERIRNSKVCNCFGVLTQALEAWRNLARFSMAAAAAGMLAISLSLEPAYPLHGAARLAGAALALSAILLALAYVFARNNTRKLPARVDRAPAHAKSPSEPFIAATRLGFSDAGQPVVLGDLATGGKPLVLLLSARACKQCQLLKSQLAPRLRDFPFPVSFIMENEPAPGDELRNCLFDPDGGLRRSLSIVGVPAMVIIDGATLKMTHAVASGMEEIMPELLGLLLDASAIRTAPAAGAQMPEPALSMS